MRPRRRRQVAESQKAEIVARLRTTRQVAELKPNEGHPTARPCVAKGRHDSEVEKVIRPLFRS
jgi:hypothetical protein